MGDNLVTYDHDCNHYEHNTSVTHGTLKIPLSSVEHPLRMLTHYYTYAPNSFNYRKFCFSLPFKQTKQRLCYRPVNRIYALQIMFNIFYTINDYNLLKESRRGEDQAASTVNLLLELE